VTLSFWKEARNKRRRGGVFTDGAQDTGLGEGTVDNPPEKGKSQRINYIIN
jgi:hypothetical protein